MIVDELNKLKQTKASIKQALIDKGQNPTDEFASYANDISNITTGGGGVSFPEGTKFAYSKFTELTPEIKNYVENYSDCTEMFAFSALTGNLELDLKATNVCQMFRNGSSGSIFTYEFLYINKLTNVVINLINEVPAVSMFYACNNLKEVTLNGSLKDCAGMFYNCAQLINLKGNINTSSCQNFGHMFYGCRQLLTLPELDTSNGTSFSNVFGECQSLTQIPKGLNTEKGTNFVQMFYGCYLLEMLPKLITNKATDLSAMVNYCDRLVKIEELSAESVTTSTLYIYSTWSSNNSIRYCLLKDIGTKSQVTTVNFSTMNNYGIVDANIPLSEGARQSLIDTLITYSYDRAAVGYSTCTIRLSTNTKALLTQDEIAQITAKGYTIA